MLVSSEGQNDPSGCLQVYDTYWPRVIVAALRIKKNYVAWELSLLRKMCRFKEDFNNDFKYVLQQYAYVAFSVANWLKCYLHLTHLPLDISFNFWEYILPCGTAYWSKARTLQTIRLHYFLIVNLRVQEFEKRTQLVLEFNTRLNVWKQLLKNLYFQKAAPQTCLYSDERQCQPFLPDVRS